MKGDDSRPGRFQAWFDLNDLQAWRMRLVDFAFLLAALVFPLSIAANLSVYLRQEHYALILLDLFLWALCLSMAFGPLRRFGRLRLAALLSLIFAMTTTFFFVLGPAQARPAWLVLCTVFGALLYGLRGALAATGAIIIMLVSIYFLTTESGGPWQFQHSQPLSHWIWFVTNSSILAFVAGASVGLLLEGLARSLRKERAAHRQLLAEIERREKLEAHILRTQKLEAIGRFASGIAHDLNNMLMPVIAYTELVANDLPQNSRSHEHLKSVLHSGLRASELVAQILTFGRAVEPERTGVDLQSIFDELATLLRPKMDARIELRIHVPELGLPPVMANRTALLQVLQNLGLNAIDAMPDGGLLCIRAFQMQTPLDDVHQICIRVEDNGCGMDTETAAKAFDPFFSTKPAGKGSGLGLAMVHGIVTALGGHIELESSPDQGSRFELHLPLTDEVAGVSANPSPSCTIRFEGKLMLVDDDDASRAAITAMLRQLGFQVEAFNGGDAALRRLKRDSKPDLLLTDWLMPDMSGRELIQAVRRLHPKLPILAVSGSASAELTETLAELGVSGLLPKPFTRRELEDLFSQNSFEFLWPKQKT